MNFYTSIFNKQIKAKQATFFILILFFILVNSVALINYVVNPMWVFNHPNYFDIKQLDYDERQQKTNYLYFQDSDYENVILGSSRTTYLNAKVFEKSLGKTFNYATNGMTPYEYKVFLANFAKLTGEEPKNIILGLDFFGMNTHTNQLFFNDKYYTQSQESFYRLKLLYNLGALKNSLNNIKQTFKDRKAHYNKSYIKHIPIKSHGEIQADINGTLKNFIPFNYDKEIFSFYQNLQRQYKRSKFIIFTPPITVEQIMLNHKNGLDEKYFKWLKELVSLFGRVNHFMYPSAFTKNSDNFYDANHFNARSGKLLSEDMLNKIKNKLEYGIVLDKNNLNDFIQNYRKLIKEVGEQNQK